VPCLRAIESDAMHFLPRPALRDWQQCDMATRLSSF